MKGGEATPSLAPQRKSHVIRCPAQNSDLLNAQSFHSSGARVSMRQKRAKTYRRVMALYTQTFNFRTPFQILGKSDLTLRSQTHMRSLLPTSQLNDGVNQLTSLLSAVTNDIILVTNSEYDLSKLLTSCVQGEIKPSQHLLQPFSCCHQKL